MMLLDLLPLLGNLLDRVLPDPKASADAKLEVMKLAQSGELAQLNADLQLATGQMEVNKAEASSADPFTSRARPFILWICGFALLYAALLEPFARFTAQVVFSYTGAFPAVDTTITLQVLLGLLGLGGLRTIEKVRGAA